MCRCGWESHECLRGACRSSQMCLGWAVSHALQAQAGQGPVLLSWGRLLQMTMSETCEQSVFSSPLPLKLNKNFLQDLGEFYFHSLHSSFISAPLLPRLPVLPRLVSGGERVHRCCQVRFTPFLGNFSGHLGETHPCSAQGDFCPAGCPHPAARRPRCPSRQLRTARPLQSVLVPSRPLRCAHGLADRRCRSQGVALIN